MQLLRVINLLKLELGVPVQSEMLSKFVIASRYKNEIMEICELDGSCLGSNMLPFYKILKRVSANCLPFEK